LAEYGNSFVVENVALPLCCDWPCLRSDGPTIFRASARPTGSLTLSPSLYVGLTVPSVGGPLSRVHTRCSLITVIKCVKIQEIYRVKVN
jgi:hypothetical protein